VWKKKKVKAGVLIYAVTMAAIFSLLLQFYLNRQVAHYQDYALNKEKLVAFAMAKRTKDKVEQESGEQAFNLGQVSYQNKKTNLVTTVRTPKSQYEFIFPSVKIKEEKRDKKEEVATDSSEKVEKKKSEEYWKKSGIYDVLGKNTDQNKELFVESPGSYVAGKFTDLNVAEVRFNFDKLKDVARGLKKFVEENTKTKDK